MVVWHPDCVVEFRFHRPMARRVHLVGEFNGWDPSATPMSRESDGYWVRHLRLEPGVYRFKYCADDEWFPDYAAFGVERGPLGWNSIVLVDELVASTSENDLTPTASHDNQTKDEFEVLLGDQPYPAPALEDEYAVACSR